MAIQGKGDQVLLLQGTGHLLSPLQGARDHLSPQQGTGDQFLPLQGRGDQLEVSRRGAESPEAGQSSQERQFEPLRIALCTYFIIIMVLISNISFINDFRVFLYIFLPVAIRYILLPVGMRSLVRISCF